MSDDHHNKGPHRGGSHGNGGHQQDDGEKTQLVDLDALQSGAEEPQFAPPPTMDSAPPPNMGASSQGGDQFEEKTELFELPPSMDDSSGGGITSSAPDYGGDSFGQHSSSQGGGYQQSSPQPPAVGSGSGQFSSVDDDGFSSVDSAAPSIGGASSQPPPPQPGSSGPQPPPPQPGSSGSQPPPPQTGSSGQQVYIPSDDDAGHDGATAFININDFAEKKAHFTPEQEQAGYDGSTQFVDINALQSGAGPGGADPIDSDDDLHRGYQFGPDDIERGDVTLIYAKNALGKDVILKRVWEDDPHTMSTPLRERIAELHELQHPNLVAMNGMFVSDSGMWAELDAPRGQRLTRIIEQNQTIEPDMVLQWVESIADALQEVHANQLAYANLTTDAVWIDDDGSVLVEPFDMLRLDDRGNLGAFGPPEMDAPPEQRELSPASDVYSLAAVIGAAVTGLPFRPQHLFQQDDAPLADKLLPALADDPSERPQTIADFRESLQGGFNLADLDIKVVGGAVFAVLFLAVGALAVISDDGGSSDAPPPDDMHAQAESPEQHGEATGGSESDEPPRAEDEIDADDDATSLDLPATVHVDDRLTIVTTYEENPPHDAVQRATDRQLDEWRSEAEALIADAEDQSGPDELDAYSSALELLTKIIQKQSDPGVEDLEKWKKIYEKEVIQDELETIIESLDEAVTEGRISTANRRYHRLSRLHPEADAENFMRAHQSAQIISLGSQEDDDDD